MMINISDEVSPNSPTSIYLYTTAHIWGHLLRAQEKWPLPSSYSPGFATNPLGSLMPSPWLECRWTFSFISKADIKLESVFFSVSEIQYSCFEDVQANGAILVPWKRCLNSQCLESAQWRDMEPSDIMSLDRVGLAAVMSQGTWSEVGQDETYCSSELQVCTYQSFIVFAGG